MISNIDNNSVVAGFDDLKDESLRILLETVGNFPHLVVVHLNGYVDTYNSSFFQRKIESVITAGYTNLIFDASQLNYLSSTGVGAFAGFLKTLKAKSGDIVLFDVQPNVYEVLQLLGFSQFFNVRVDRKDALAYFKDTQSTPDIFPKAYHCPHCTAPMQANNAGRYHCDKCGAVIDIDDNGAITLG